MNPSRVGINALGEVIGERYHASIFTFPGFNLIHESHSQWLGVDRSRRVLYLDHNVIDIGSNELYRFDITPCVIGIPVQPRIIQIMWTLVSQAPVSIFRYLYRKIETDACGLCGHTQMNRFDVCTCDNITDPGPFTAT